MRSRRITAEARRRGGAEKKTRLKSSVVRRGQKLKTGEILRETTTSSGLAAGCGPPRGFRAGLLRDDCIHHGARKNAFDPSLGSSGCAAKGFRAVTEQGSHIGGPALVGTEMNSQ